MSVHHSSRGKNHEAVMAVLEHAGKPMSAYEILDCLRPAGITAPPTVYRALERLVAEGRVHRLESLNAFVPCCDGGHQQGVVIFTICDDCGAVEEISDPALEAQLNAAARTRDFCPSRSLIEIHGQCRHCCDPAGKTGAGGALVQTAGHGKS